MTLKFSELFGEKLGTRHVGAIAREILLKEISEHQRVVFDFQGVKLVTNSFADECFGKLLFIYSLDELRNKSTFKNVDKDSEMIIHKAIKERTANINKELVC